MGSNLKESANTTANQGRAAFRAGLFDLYGEHLDMLRGMRIIDSLLDFKQNFICPICHSVLPRDITGNTIDVDHVPPKKLGGTYDQGILMCRKCNNDLGSAIDSQLIQIMKMRENAQFIVGTRFDIVYSFYDAQTETKRFPGELVVPDGNSIHIIGHPHRANPKDKKAESDLLDAHTNVNTGDIHVHVSIPGGYQMRARSSFIKIGYLTAFRELGYLMALNPTMEPVQQQILDPSLDVVPEYACQIDSEFSNLELGVHIVHSPETHRCLISRFDLKTDYNTYRCAVILPHLDRHGLDVYKTIEAGTKKGEQVHLLGTHIKAVSAGLARQEYLDELCRRINR